MKNGMQEPGTLQGETEVRSTAEKENPKGRIEAFMEGKCLNELRWGLLGVY